MLFNMTASQQEIEIIDLKNKQTKNIPNKLYKFDWFGMYGGFP